MRLPSMPRSSRHAAGSFSVDINAESGAIAKGVPDKKPDGWQVIRIYLKPSPDHLVPYRKTSPTEN